MMIENGDRPVGPQPGDIGPEWLDFYRNQPVGEGLKNTLPGLPSLTPDINIDPINYGIPEIDLSGVDLSQIGAPEIDLSGVDLTEIEEKYGFTPDDVLPSEVSPIMEPRFPIEPEFDPNIMVPRGQDREMPVGLPEPVGIAGLPSFEEMTGGGGFPPEIPPETIQSIEQRPQLFSPSTPMPMAPPPETIQSIEQTPPMPVPMPMAPEEVEQIKEVIPQLPPEQIKEVLPSLPPEVIEQVLPMLPPEIIQPPAAPMPAISSYVPTMPVAPVSPKVSPVRRPVRRGGRGARTSKNLGGIVNSMGSMPLKYTYK